MKSICITEWKTESIRRIDILLKIIDKQGNTKAVIRIENKVDSGEQRNQIKDYRIH
ncbi:MAG: PD-(D/E)XK nuclease family protein [Bacteroidales bacterium]|nr:PD-(D/E)XK nuclease family protein [Bacteroidales bacterium]